MATRGYTAVEMKYIGASIEKVSVTAKKSFTINGVNGACVNINAGEKFYLVRAGSLGPDMWYIVRSVFGEKKCSCASHKPCVHEIHVATGKPLAELRAEVRARAETRKAVKIETSKTAASKVASVTAPKVGASKLPTAPKYDPSKALFGNQNRAFSILR